MQDLFGREINYLRISITDLCNLRCRYCMPESGIGKIPHENMLTFEETLELTRSFVKCGINKIRITGGEPLIRKDCIKLIRAIGKEPGIMDLSITTNGQLLAENAWSLKEAGINRVNISLDSMDEHRYSEITRKGSLKKVLEGIREAEKAGLTPIKLNVVLIGGFNVHEIRELVNLTRDSDISVRFIELMPIGEASSWAEEKFVSSKIVLEKAKELVPVNYKDKSSPASYYKIPGAKGTVGLISPLSCGFCHSCNRIRLTTTGILRTCLHSDKGINLGEHLRSGNDIEKIIGEAILSKPESHNLLKGRYIKGNMSQIGG